MTKRLRKSLTVRPSFQLRAAEPYLHEVKMVKSPFSRENKINGAARNIVFFWLAKFLAKIFNGRYHVLNVFMQFLRKVLI